MAISNLTYKDYLWIKKENSNIYGIRLSKNNLPTDTIYSSSLGEITLKYSTWSEKLTPKDTKTVTIPNGEAFLSWGGKNFSSSYGPIDAAMVPALGANRLAFATAAGIEVEYSRDAGATWTDYGLTNEQKRAIFSGPQISTSVVIGKPGSKDSATGTFLNASVNNRARITITTNKASIYTVLNKFVIYCSTNGSQDCRCTIQGQTKTNYDAGNDKWSTFANEIGISGWSGFNVINTSGITTYGNTSSQYIKLRFIFYCKTAGSMATSGGLQIINIYGFGGVGWTTPSTMAKWGQMYTYDASQNVTFPASITSGAINSYNVVPRTNNTYNLGSSNYKWANIYATTIYENGTSLADKYAAKSHTHNYNDLSNRPNIPNPTNYYWANVKISSSSSKTTTPIFDSVEIKEKCIVSYSATADALEFIFK